MAYRNKKSQKAGSITSSENKPIGEIDQINFEKMEDLPLGQKTEDMNLSISKNLKVFKNNIEKLNKVK